MWESRRLPTTRTIYRPSGRVDWDQFLPLALLTLVLSVLGAAGMAYVHTARVHIPIVSPLFLAAPAILTAIWTFFKGRCRNRAVVAILAGLVGVIVAVGHYQIEFAVDKGWAFLPRLDLSPAWLESRLANTAMGALFDKIPYIYWNGRDDPPRYPDLLAAWSFLFVEVFFIALLVFESNEMAVGLFSEARCVWMKRSEVRAQRRLLEPMLHELENGSIVAIVDQIEPGDYAFNDHLELWIDHPPPRAPVVHPELVGDDHVYITVRSWDFNGKDLEREEHLKRWSLEPDEVAALARLVPELKLLTGTRNADAV